MASVTDLMHFYANWSNTNMRSNAVKRMPHLSANTSRGDAPCAQLFTIQAESMAARKPLAMPVPIGQKGYRKQVFFFLISLNINIIQCT